MITALTESEVFPNFGNCQGFSWTYVTMGLMLKKLAQKIGSGHGEVLTGNAVNP